MVRDFAMALRARIVSGAFEKRAPGLQCFFFGGENPLNDMSTSAIVTLAAFYNDRVSNLCRVESDPVHLVVESAQFISRENN